MVGLPIDVGTPIKVEVKGIGWRPLESSWMLL
jgi:hypothetical protein